MIHPILSGYALTMYIIKKKLVLLYQLVDGIDL